MLLIEGVAELTAALEARRATGATVGLVPTMGGLHDGHASLIERAAGECSLTCVSVFVNPFQFGSADEASAYPREVESDLVVADKAGADVVFAPTVGEMYPETPAITVRVGGHLGATLEGASRPGHLDGVASVVAKLFAMAGPCRAYFGEKDYQQLLVVRRLAADLSFPVTVVACPTVRGIDGVAESSRNRLLSSAEREAAGVLCRALRAGAAAILAGESERAQVEALMADIIAAEPLVELDYAVVVDATSLDRPERLAGDLRLLVAAGVGGTRLIDNVGVRAR